MKSYSTLSDSQQCERPVTNMQHLLRFQKVPSGFVGRTIIIGDVHGCFDELQELLKKVNWEREKDRLVFVGDLVNKGPKSLEVISSIFHSLYSKEA